MAGLNEPRAVILWKSPITRHWFSLARRLGGGYLITAAVADIAKASKIPLKHALLFVEERNERIKERGLSGSYLLEVVND